MSWHAHSVDRDREHENGDPGYLLHDHPDEDDTFHRHDMAVTATKMTEESITTQPWMYFDSEPYIKTVFSHSVSDYRAGMDEYGGKVNAIEREVVEEVEL